MDSRWSFRSRTTIPLLQNSSQSGDSAQRSEVDAVNTKFRVEFVTLISPSSPTKTVILISCRAVSPCFVALVVLFRLLAKTRTKLPCQGPFTCEIERFDLQLIASLKLREIPLCVSVLFFSLSFCLGTKQKDTVTIQRERVWETKMKFL